MVWTEGEGDPPQVPAERILTAAKAKRKEVTASDLPGGRVMEGMERAASARRERARHRAEGPHTTGYSEPVREAVRASRSCAPATVSDSNGTLIPRSMISSRAGCQTSASDRRLSAVESYRAT